MLERIESAKIAGFVLFNLVAFISLVMKLFSFILFSFICIEQVEPYICCLFSFLLYFIACLLMPCY